MIRNKCIHAVVFFESIQFCTVNDTKERKKNIPLDKSNPLKMRNYDNILNKLPAVHILEPTCLR